MTQAKRIAELEAQVETLTRVVNSLCQASMAAHQVAEVHAQMLDIIGRQLHPIQYPVGNA